LKKQTGCIILPKKSLMKKFSLAILLLTVCACGSDDDPAPISEELLAGSTSKTWYLTDQEAAGFADFEDQPTCIQDDRWVFYSIGTMEQNEGASKCDPADPQIYVNGTWELFPESKTLKLTRSNIMNFTVSKLTANVMILTTGSDKLYFAKE
jgi:hypothetical protein